MNKRIVIIDDGPQEVTEEQWKQLSELKRWGEIQLNEMKDPICPGPADIFRSKTEDLGGEIQER